MAIPREWLTFLREQFPVGSRIKLQEMKDPYHPVEPGTMGTLTNIDDAGTFHMKWDNGRGLGLVLGEDRFSILPPETHLLKLYMPMTVDCYDRNRWGDYENEPEDLSASEILEYEDAILDRIEKEKLPDEGERGLAIYLDIDLREKVHSIHPSVEEWNDELWGVTEVQTRGELTPNEYAELTEWLTGQFADGWGEGFEQREIKVDEGELCVSFWDASDRFFIKPENEMESQSFSFGMGGLR